MSFLVDLLAGGWAKLAGVFGVVAALVAGWLSIRKSGRDAERAAALGQQQQKVEDANQARNRVGDADVDRLLTNPRDRH